MGEQVAAGILYQVYASWVSTCCKQGVKSLNLFCQDGLDNLNDFKSSDTYLENRILNRND